MKCNNGFRAVGSFAVGQSVKYLDLCDEYERRVSWMEYEQWNYKFCGLKSLSFLALVILKTCQNSGDRWTSNDWAATVSTLWETQTQVIPYVDTRTVVEELVEVKLRGVGHGCVWLHIRVAGVFRRTRLIRLQAAVTIDTTGDTCWAKTGSNHHVTERSTGKFLRKTAQHASPLTARQTHWLSVVIKIMCNKHPPVYIARYSFTQLSELKQRRVNKLSKDSKRK